MDIHVQAVVFSYFQIFKWPKRQMQAIHIQI